MVRTGICNKDFLLFFLYRPKSNLTPCKIRIEVSFHFYLRDKQYQV